METRTGTISQLTRDAFFALIISLIPIFLYAQNPVSGTVPKAVSAPPTPSPRPDQKDQKRPPAIVDLIKEARLAAPELTADTLLKLLETKKVSEKGWRRELVDESLRLIEDLPTRVSLRAATIRGVNLSNTNIYLAAAANSLKLDQLSLRSRIIKVLAENDPERARQMLIYLGGQLGLKPRSCDDALVYEVDSIYTAVAQVAKAAFSKSQTIDGQRALFLSPWIENIDSPTQINPALALIEQMDGPPVEKQMLLNALGRSLDRSFNDDRSFSAVASLIGRKMTSLRPIDDSLRRPLFESYRGFVAKNVRSTRCKDNVITRNDPLPAYIATANELFPEKPLSIDDVVTLSSEGGVKVIDIVAKSSAVGLFGEELRGLRLVNNKVTSPDPTDLVWQQRVRALAEKITLFEGKDGETEEEMLLIKNQLFGAILQMVTGPELRKAIFTGSFLILTRSSLQKKDFPAWFYLARSLQHSDSQLFSDLVTQIPNPNLILMVKTAHGIPAG